MRWRSMYFFSVLFVRKWTVDDDNHCLLTGSWRFSPCKHSPFSAPLIFLTLLIFLQPLFVLCIFYPSWSFNAPSFSASFSVLIFLQSFFILCISVHLLSIFLFRSSLVLYSEYTWSCSVQQQLFLFFQEYAIPDWDKFKTDDMSLFAFLCSFLKLYRPWIF